MGWAVALISDLSRGLARCSWLGFHFQADTRVSWSNATTGFVLFLQSLPKGQSSARLQLWMVILFHNYIDKVSAIVESKMPLTSTSSFHVIFILQEKHFLFLLVMWCWLYYSLKGKSVCRYCWWLRWFIRQAVVLRAECACSVDTLSAVKHY